VTTTLAHVALNHGQVKGHEAARPFTAGATINHIAIERALLLAAGKQISIAEVTYLCQNWNQ